MPRASNRLATVTGLVSLLATAGGAIGAVNYTALAFGPLGTTVPGQYFTQVADISADGRSFIGVLNTNAIRFRTPGGDFTFAGTGGPFSLSADGQVVAGGLSGANPQRWDLANASGSTLPSTTITWPGGPIAWGPAYATNADGSDFLLITPGQLRVVTPNGIANSLPAFQAQGLGSTPGVFRAMAPSAPVVAMHGTVAGNTQSNAARWNYQTGTVSMLQLPAGSEAYGISLGGASLGVISYDGSIVGGSARFGTLLRPYWWDADGVPHAVALLPNAVAGSVNALNYTGTLGGGSMTIPGAGVGRAFMVELASGELFDLTSIYSEAGLLPAGWILTSTRHISDDGSRVFALARAPDGTDRMVVLDGLYVVPEPATLASLGIIASLAMRRRR